MASVEISPLVWPVRIMYVNRWTMVGILQYSTQ